MPEVRVKKESALSGNVALAAEIFSEYGDFIRAVIRYKVKNEAWAEDLFQDFFLSLVSKPIPAGVQNVRSYLYRAITNDIADGTRRVEQYKARINKYAERLNFFINKSTPENALIEAEEIDKMFKLIEGWLRHSESQAVRLRYRKNYNIKEIAKKMHVNNRTVSRYISTGLSKIRQSLPAKQGD